MTNVEPYLIFDGECAEAFAFYETVFETRIAYSSKYKDIPPGEREVSEADKDRIVHTLLPISKQVALMGADSTSEMKNTRGDNIWLVLNTESMDEAKRVFERISEGGKVIMPLEKTFWAELYGMVMDKFGIGWMVSFSSQKQQ